MDKVAALREFRVLHTALHSSSSYREAVSVCRSPLPERFLQGLQESVNAGESVVEGELGSCCHGYQESSGSFCHDCRSW